MSTDEKDPRREVNPAQRRDEPHEPEPGEGLERPEGPVKATQGAELDPRDQGGIAE